MDLTKNKNNFPNSHKVRTVMTLALIALGLCAKTLVAFTEIFFSWTTSNAIPPYKHFIFLKSRSNVGEKNQSGGNLKVRCNALCSSIANPSNQFYPLVYAIKFDSIIW